jgi:putative tryptophan/tyrosine transport system substrate-binding protein
MRASLVALLALALLAAPLAAEAQQARKVWRIGLLVPGQPPSCDIDSQPAVSRALRDGLRELGYVEMQNYVFVARCAEREGDDMRRAARDLVGQQVDVVLVGSNELTEALKQATTTVPVVFIAVADPEEDRPSRQLGPAGWEHHGLQPFDW